MILYNSVALYAPSLAIASITNIPITVSILITAVLSAFYISVVSSGVQYFSSYNFFPGRSKSRNSHFRNSNVINISHNDLHNFNFITRDEHPWCVHKCCAWKAVHSQWVSPYNVWGMCKWAQPLRNEIDSKISLFYSPQMQILTRLETNRIEQRPIDAHTEFPASSSLLEYSSVDLIFKITLQNPQYTS